MATPTPIFRFWQLQHPTTQPRPAAVGALNGGRTGSWAAVLTPTAERRLNDGRFDGVRTAAWAAVRTAAAALASGRRPGGGAGPGFHVASGVGPAFSSRHGGGGNGMEMIKELNFSFYLKFSTSINFNGKKFMNDEIFTIKP